MRCAEKEFRRIRSNIAALGTRQTRWAVLLMLQDPSCLSKDNEEDVCRAREVEQPRELLPIAQSQGLVLAEDNHN